jgi:hypothetical protein
MSRLLWLSAHLALGALLDLAWPRSCRPLPLLVAPKRQRRAEETS